MGAFILTSCCCFRATDFKPVKENWLCHLNLDTRLWTCNADSWFLTGEINQLQRSILRPGPDKVITKTSVQVPHFDKIVANGSFQIQIVGNQDREKVDLLGSNLSARQVAIETKGDTLYLYQPTNKITANDITIIRISVRNLKCLTNLGCGNIYGRGVLSNRLTIFSAGAGDIMLMGDMNLAQVKQVGSGKIVVLGANTPSLDISLQNHNALAAVDVCGHVGVRSIINCGKGQVNIIGADTDSLTIAASFSSLTTVIGYANLKKVSAINQSRVYLYWVNSDSTTVYATDKAQVGLAGNTGSLSLVLKNSADFEGQYLRSDSVNVKTNNYSHANVATHNRLFAEARDESSIYYFDSPKDISDFRWGDGIVIPLQHTPCPCPTSPPRR
ncbi:MAG: GIN domain-containing protein [Gammaproteobacteria bacterium]